MGDIASDADSVLSDIPDIVETPPDSPHNDLPTQEKQDQEQIEQDAEVSGASPNTQRNPAADASLKAAANKQSEAEKRAALQATLDNITQNLENHSEGAEKRAFLRAELNAAMADVPPPPAQTLEQAKQLAPKQSKDGEWLKSQIKLGKLGSAAEAYPGCETQSEFEEAIEAEEQAAYEARRRSEKVEAQAEDAAKAAAEDETEALPELVSPSKDTTMSDSRPKRARKAPPHRHEMPTPKKPAKRPVKKKKIWDAENILTDPKSPLATADLRSLLSNPKAWDILSPEDRREILDLLHAETPTLFKDEQERPDLEALKNDDTFRHDCANFTENLAQGRFEQEWLESAWAAHERRKMGDFDDYQARMLEENWGIELPDGLKPRRNTKQDVAGENCERQVAEKTGDAGSKPDIEQRESNAPSEDARPKTTFQEDNPRSTLQHGSTSRSPQASTRSDVSDNGTLITSKANGDGKMADGEHSPTTTYGNTDIKSEPRSSKEGDRMTDVKPQPAASHESKAEATEPSIHSNSVDKRDIKQESDSTKDGNRMAAIEEFPAMKHENTGQGGTSTEAVDAYRKGSNPNTSSDVSMGIKPEAHIDRDRMVIDELQEEDSQPQKQSTPLVQRPNTSNRMEVECDESDDELA